MQLKPRRECFYSDFKLCALGRCLTHNVPSSGNPLSEIGQDLTHTRPASSQVNVTPHLRPIGFCNRSFIFSSGMPVDEHASMFIHACVMLLFVLCCTHTLLCMLSSKRLPWNLIALCAKDVFKIFVSVVVSKMDVLNLQEVGLCYTRRFTASPESPKKAWYFYCLFNVILW